MAKNNPDGLMHRWVAHRPVATSNSPEASPIAILTSRASLPPICAEKRWSEEMVERIRTNLKNENWPPGFALGSNRNQRVDVAPGFFATRLRCAHLV